MSTDDWQTNQMRLLEMRLMAIRQRTIDMDALIEAVRAAIPDDRDQYPPGIPATLKARREYYKFKRRSEAGPCQ